MIEVYISDFIEYCRIINIYLEVDKMYWMSVLLMAASPLDGDAKSSVLDHMILGFKVSQVLAGLIGVVFGAVLTLLLSMLAEYLKYRRESVVNIHKEWYEMMDVRAEILKDLKKYSDPNVSPKLKFQNNVWKIMGFYERLYFYFSNNFVSRRMICDLFGENLHWWHDRVLSTHLNSDPKTKPSLDCLALHSAIWRMATPRQRKIWGEHTETVGPKVLPSAVAGRT